ncbi:uncharacterized protein LOC143460655 isoform X2 [Clavelina lepadiformis]|uniref:uncharacterized protein LOC143460655 isoform X2 n=1 Tax=Clavelina lepadiformis TaxID=159417 RepID=UPI0040429FFF
MTKCETFTVLTDKGKIRFKRDSLIEKSEYFRGLFHSNMRESQLNLLDLRTRSKGPESKMNPVDPSALKDLAKFLPEIREASQITSNFDKLFGLLRDETEVAQHSPIKKCHTSSLRLWLTRSSDRNVKNFLSATSYFQFTGLINQLENCNSCNLGKSPCDVEVAARVLPYSLECGLLGLHSSAMASAAQNFVEFLRCGKQNKIKIDEVIVSKIRENRTGAGSTNNSLSAVLRTDIQVDSLGAVRCSYALLEFKEDSDALATDPSSPWKPRLIDVFTTGADEHVTDAVTIDNYLYIITSQYCKRMNETKIRVRRFNPFYCSKISSRSTVERGEVTVKKYNDIAGTKSREVTTSDQAWSSKSETLTKKGFVSEMRAIVVVDRQNESCHSQYTSPTLYLLGGKRINQKKRNGKTETRAHVLSDVDSFDPISNKWTTCPAIPFESSQKKGFYQKSECTSHQILSLLIETNSDGLPDDVIRVRISKKVQTKRNDLRRGDIKATTETQPAADSSYEVTCAEHYVFDVVSNRPEAERIYRSQRAPGQQ